MTDNEAKIVKNIPWVKHPENPDCWIILVDDREGERDIVMIRDLRSGQPYDVLKFSTPDEARAFVKGQIFRDYPLLFLNVTTGEVQWP